MQVAKILPENTELINCPPDTDLKEAVIDSRSAGSGAVFIPLKGTRQDGHEFIEAAIKSGAALSLCERAYFAAHGDELAGLPLLLCDSSLRTLQELAAAKYRAIRPGLIAITGSVGKTSTRLLLSHILESSFKVHQSMKNYNNHIGYPLSLFNMSEDSRVLVMEMGANHPGEIAELCRIAAPDHALITRISPAHIEGFGTIEKVREAKFEIFRNSSSDAVLYINGNDEHIRSFSDEGRRIVRYGTGSGMDHSYRISEERSRFKLKFDSCGIEAYSANPGFLENAAAAAVIALDLGLDPQVISERIHTFKLPAGRGDELLLGGITLINDAYNASPLSLKNAVTALQKRECSGRKAVVFADMLEMGELSEAVHAAAGRDIAEKHPDLLLLYGTGTILTFRSAKTAGMKRVYHYRSREELLEHLVSWLKPGDCVLFKGSRSMGLDIIIAEAEKFLGKAGMTDAE